MAATMSRAMRTSERWQERIGMSPAECRVLIAVLSYYAVHGKPVLSTQIRDFLIELGEPTDSRPLAALAKRGWVKAVGKVVCTVMYEPTDRGYRFLGFEPRKAA